MMDNDQGYDAKRMRIEEKFLYNDNQQRRKKYDDSSYKKALLSVSSISSSELKIIG